jgi:hypothetical protein
LVWYKVGIMAFVGSRLGKGKGRNRDWVTVNVFIDKAIVAMIVTFIFVSHAEEMAAPTDNIVT